MLLAAVLAFAAMLLAIGALVRDQVKLRRQVRGLAASIAIEAQDRAIADHKLTARQDRLQSMVTDRGWRDSMLLTSINWKKPPDDF